MLFAFVGLFVSRITEGVDDALLRFFEMRISLATDRLTSVLIRITIRIQEFLTEFLLLRYQ